MDYDVIIVGAGVVGCAIARELSRYRWNILLLDKEHDVTRGASGRNSGVVHSGVQVPPGSLKATLNIAGSKQFPKFCRELGVPYRRVGKLIVAQHKRELATLAQMEKDAEKSGIADLKILDKPQLKQREPYINGIAALSSQGEAIFSPYTLNIALAENAQLNGVHIKLNTQVSEIDRSKNKFKLITNNGAYSGRYLVNRSGVWADKLAELAGISGYRIYPCRGEDWVRDKEWAKMINSMVYPVPVAGSGGLGIHLTPAIDGNILIGPSAEYINGREDYRTTRPILNRLYREARQLLPSIDRRYFIAGYTGIRSKLCRPGSTGFSDFLIQEEPKVKGFINLLGIESPGLSAAPAIAQLVRKLIAKGLKLETNPDFNPIRKPKTSFNNLSIAKKAAQIKADPLSGEMVCRCEQVTRREVVAAIQNTLGAKSVSAVKYRCRAGMGRCQGGYCLPRIVDMLQEHTTEEITLHGPGSHMFIGSTKELLKCYSKTGN